MDTSSRLDIKDKKELLEQCRHLQDLLNRQKMTACSWIDTLAAVALTDQELMKSLAKGLRFIVEACRMDGGCIHLFDQEEQVLRLTVCLGLSKPVKENLQIIRGRGHIPHDAAPQPESLIAPAVDHMAALSAKITQTKDGISHAGFPLNWNGILLGSLMVLSKRHRRFSETDMELLRAFSRFLTVVIQNLTLFNTVCQGKRQWENAFDSISDLVIICDREFRIVKTNRAMMDRFWLPLEDAIGKECFSLLYNGTPLQVSRKNLEEMLKQGVTYHEEVSHSRCEGVFSIVVSPILTSGGLAGSIHVIREITQEKLLQKDREELARKVSLFAPGTITISPEGTIRSWDSGATKILGYEEKQVKDKPLSIIFSSLDSKTLIQRVKDSEGILDFETTAVTQGKQPILVSLTLSAHQNQKEGLKEITIFLRSTKQRQENSTGYRSSPRLTAMIDAATNMSQELWVKLETMATRHGRIEGSTHDMEVTAKRLKRLAGRARSLREILDRLRKCA